MRISNKDARHILLNAHGLAVPPTGPVNVANIIRNMGFVQLDTIRNVSRAHHHILWSRNQNYREAMLWQTLEQREIFEHFTHDASLLPIELYPLWRWQFTRMKNRLTQSKRWNIEEALNRDIKSRIAAEGPLSTRAFDTKVKGPKQMWSRPPHKNALDYLWYIGELSTAHRVNFIKFYDFSEQVIPSHIYNMAMPNNPLGQLCRAALDKLWIATAAEIQDFWGAASAVQVKHWLENCEDIKRIRVQGADGHYYPAYAVVDIDKRLESIGRLSSRLRILSPFDPLIRNRKRLKRIFGFDYKIEIFVPAAKRRWGYYVYPILQGARLVGRAELSADRKAGTLHLKQLWREEDVQWTDKHDSKLKAELTRLARFIGVKPMGL